MDNRNCLEHGAILKFPGFECFIEEIRGKGSNGIVYEAYYMDKLDASKKHRVLIKELYPLYPKKAIRRLKNNSILVDDDAKDFYALHEKSFINGNNVHLTLLEKFPDKISSNINTYKLNNTLYTVMGITDGDTLERIIHKEKNTDISELVKRFLHIINALKVFHEFGYLHLDISPDNIIITGSGEEERAFIIDYNSAIDMSHIMDSDMYLSIKKGYTAPEVVLGNKRKIGLSSDIYSLIASFYYCMAGKRLSELQMVKRTPPDISNCEGVSNQPETVKELLRNIFTKGLSILPERRYRSLSEVELDFQELLERISGVGITHWAIWEGEKRSLKKLVMSNPSYKYIEDTDELYAVKVTSQNEDRQINELIDEIINGKTDSSVIIGGGGTGKTTALLSAAFSGKNNYSSNDTAVIYISLYGAKSTTKYFIRDKILENLHFNAGITSFEMARHRLDIILNNPTNNPENKKAYVLIMLDGFNEASGDLSLLTDEINELSQMRGVRFVITGRNPIKELSFRTFFVAPLSDPDISAALSKHGLLMPQNKNINQAIQTPIMLSLFIKTADNSEKQPMLDSVDDLIDKYFEYLYLKEIRDLPEASREKWVIEVALKYVLTRIAYETKKQNGPLSRKKLLSVISKCYRLLKSKITSLAFPELIGYKKDIFFGAKNAEEWYGIVVNDILWRRAGLLIYEDDGFRITHQILEEYLQNKYLKKKKKIAYFKTCKALLYTLCYALSLSLLLFTASRIFPKIFEESVFVKMIALPEEKSAKVMGYAVKSYLLSGVVCEQELSDLKAIQDKTEFKKTQGYRIFFDSYETLELEKKIANITIRQLSEEGNIMPWSYKKIDYASLQKLIDRPLLLNEKYKRYEEYFEYAEKYNDKEFFEELKSLTETDAKLTSALYFYTVYPHINAMDKDSVTYTSIINVLGQQNVEIEEMRFSDTEEKADEQRIKVYEDKIKEIEDRLYTYEKKYDRIKERL